MKNELGGRELGTVTCFVSTSFLTLSQVWKSYWINCHAQLIQLLVTTGYN